MSDPIDTGGMAYPTLDNAGSGLHLREMGMTLRDHFAGQALSGLMAYSNSSTGVGFNNTTEGEVAEYAYRLSDAMIAARKEQS
jgi:hypothetical protein